MRGLLDFSSWSGLFTTLAGLLLMTLLMVGVRLVFMQTMQRKRERENRQINERLKTLIAAYKILGGSFTGELSVDPAHLRDLRRLAESGEDSDFSSEAAERRRRIRDAVEAALSDVILLGTEEQMRLAAAAASDMVTGRHVETSALVASLRNFIRQALDLDPVPGDLTIPEQGPMRVVVGGSGKRGADAGRGGDGAAGGRGGAGAGAAAGGGAGMGVGMGAGAGTAAGRGAELPSDPER
ncbi:hypothetical protein OS176_07655 [Xanthomonadaceae bacterium XH05]|nr:hypothetical protein [Xanthomonadaceae bacterium XH05]